jgi:predicted MFS family arabinose efflux permease
MDAAGAPDALPRGAVVLLSLAAFGSGMSMRVNDALLPLLSSTFAVSIGDASAVIGVFAVAYGLAQLGFGPVGDRFGKYRVIAWGSAASALTALLCALAPGLPALVGARVLAGATAAAIIPLSMAWIGDTVPYEQRQPVLARFLVGQIAGAGGGVWLGGVAADLHTWRAPFAILAALFACVAWGLLAMEPKLPARARTRQVVESGALRHLVDAFSDVLRVPWARWVLLLVGLEGALFFGAFAFIATHVHLQLGLPLSVTGSIVMLFGAGGLVFAALSGRLLGRLGEPGLARGGAALAAASLALVAWAPHWSAAVIGCLMAGLGFFMMHNTLQVNATQMAPARRGAAVASFASCFFLGQAAGVALAGSLVTRYGAAPLLRVAAVGVLGVGLLLGHRLARKARAGS